MTKESRNRSDRYIHCATLLELDKLSTGTPGSRNIALYTTACRLFELCRGLNHSKKVPWIKYVLLEACLVCGLPENDARKTIASAEERCFGKFKPVFA